MPTYRDKGIVLRKRTLRDADCHYTVFTEHHGKIVLLAKGSRRGKSKMSPHMGTLGVVDIMVAEGRVIDRLAGAALIRPFAGLFGSLPKLTAAQGFLLAVDALTRRDLPEERIYRLLISFLEALESAREEEGTRTPVFDAAAIKLFEALGLAMELGCCVRCRQPLTRFGNAMNVVAGGIECPSCRDPAAMDVSAEAVETMRLLRRADLSSVAGQALAMRVRREVGFIVDLALSAWASTAPFTNEES